jgi:NAD(P)-dependent dehydrogenase (short-subunit alcohol dehydrogenase family)
MSSKLFNLEGKTAIIVGGSKGLGKGMATALASAGANIVIASRSQNALDKVSKEINKITGVKILPIVFNVTEKGDIIKLVKKTVVSFNRIDILVNSAGMNIRKPAEEVTEEDWDNLMDVQLKGVFFTCQEVGKVMIRQKKGKIINIASLTSKLGLPNMIAYCSAKGGIVQMTKALATEWAKYNINVNAIGPGYYKTEQTKALFDDKEKLEGLLKRIPFGRTGLPEDLAGAIIFLASEGSNYLTGQTIYVDGGWLAS